MLVLDSGGLSRLSRRSLRSAALVVELRWAGLWPPVVPTIVLAESTAGTARVDTTVNRFLVTCRVEPMISERVARRAGQLRAKAGRGSAVDALVVALAEPGGTVLTGDRADLEALAANADDVAIELI